MNRTPYYALTTSGREADVTVFGEITSWPWMESDVSSYNLRHEIAQLDVDTINVHINSYGGEVAEALAITNALLQHPAKINTFVDGFACSAATIIFMAGERRVVAKCSNFLVHPAWTYTGGNATQLRAEADNLDAMTEQSINAYLSRITKSREELVELMESERFLTPEETLEWGFATEIEDLFGRDHPSQSVRTIVYEMLHQKKNHDISDNNPNNDDPKETELSKFLEALGKI